MQAVTVTIEPGQLAWLDSQAESMRENRSVMLRLVLRRAIAADQPQFTPEELRIIRRFLGDMVDRVKGPGSEEAKARYDDGIVCVHPSPYEILTGGMRRCKQCGAVQGADEKWRTKR